MKEIKVYDTEADSIEIIAENNDMTVAEVVQLLCDYIEYVKLDNNLK